MKHSDVLRAVADWLDATPAADPEAMPSYNGLGLAGEPTWRILDGRPWDAERMAELARGIGGRWQKDVDESYFWLKREIAPGVTYCLYAMRNVVCTARVVGTEEVEVTDPDAPKVKVTRDVVEWDCPDSLLGATA